MSNIIKTVFILPILCFTEIYQIEWVEIVDNGYDDIAYDVDVDDLNNIIVTGMSGINSYLDKDIYTVKFDPQGTIVWVDTIDYNNSSEEAHGVAVDRKNNILITGHTWFNGCKYLTLKFDPSGTMLWDDTINTGSYELAEDVAVDSLDNIVITGVSYIGLPLRVTVKYDSSGAIVWGDTVNYGEVHHGYGVAVDNNNNIIVASSCNINLSHEDVVILKYDPSGLLLRVDTLDHNGSRDQVRDIAVDNDNCVIIAGTIIDYPYSGFVVKYDSSGSIHWKDIIGTGLHAVDVDSANNIVVAGYANISGNNNFLSVKYDPYGEILWQHCFDGSGADFVHGVAFDRTGNYIIVGERITNSQSDFYIAYYDLLVGITEDESSNSVGQNSPITTLITGPLVLPEGKHCRIFDIIGKEVIPSEIRPGIYFIEVEGCITSKVVKLR